MRRLRLITALAVVMATAIINMHAIAKNKTQSGGFDWYWHKDDAGLSTNSPLDFEQLGYDPGCSGSEIVCAIRVKLDNFGNIDQSAFNALYNASSQFTIAGIYLIGGTYIGTVELKNN